MKHVQVVAPDDGIISARSATVGAVVPAGTELFRMIRHDLPRVDQPMIIYKSRVDHVLGDRSLEIIRDGVRSRDIAVVYLERSYHVATLDYDADLIFSGTSEFFTRLATATK